MNTLSHQSAICFFNAAKALNPKAAFRLCFFKHDGSVRDMTCNFDLATNHVAACFQGKVTVFDLEAEAPKTFRIDRLAFIAIDDRSIWFIADERGAVPRIHSRHLEMRA